jgi:hypothetical protein
MSGLPIDNSTQLPQTSFTSGPPDFANVNEWSKIGNNLYNTSLGNKELEQLILMDIN